MEHISKHLAVQEQNLSLTQTPLGILSTEESETLKAIEDVKIFRVTNLELKQTLVYIFGLVGLHPEKFPDELAEISLMDFIRTEYAGHTLAELRLAFRMAIAGKLSTDIKHYNTFSALYIAGVMNPYRVWASQVRDQHERTKKELPPSRFEITDDDALEAAQNAFKANGMFQLIPPYAYDILVKQGKINLDVEQKKEIRSLVVQMVHNSTKDLHETINSMADKEEWLKGECRKFATARYFQSLITKQKV